MKKILVIEDEQAVRENILEMLDAEEFEPVGAENGYVGLRLATEEQPDVILCDVMMPQLDGYGVLTALRNNPVTAMIPFIFLTAKAARADLRQGMELGADDYLTKPFTREELLGAIASRLKKRDVQVQQYTTELKQLENKLNHLLHYDSLTNLPNRLLLRSLFEQVVENITNSTATSASKNYYIPILCLGLDRFTRINETLGHSFGDLAIKTVAQRLVSCVGNLNQCARLNADQFVIITKIVEQRNDVANLTKIILETLSKPLIIEDQEVFITASIGIALYPKDGQQIDKLLQNANKAMNRAKQMGGNNYQFYLAALHVGYDDIITLETSLRHALEREELMVYYQPQVNIKTGRIVGAEALLRWQHPQLGYISPGKFIPLAEETGLIISIGEWILKIACKQAKAWQELGFENFRIAVNLSGRQFNQPLLRQKLVQLLLETDFKPEHLELELTESLLIQNPEVASNTLKGLKTLGIQIAIDDFGTGYSSLGYLQRFNFDTLKIDKCFVEKVALDETSKSLTQAIIEMAHSLNLKLIAEGVEAQAELEFLQKHHCDEFQGYFFSPPVSAKAFEKLLMSEMRLH